MGMDNRAAVVSHARQSQPIAPPLGHHAPNHNETDKTGVVETAHAPQTAGGAHVPHFSQSQQFRSSHNIRLSEDELDHHVLDIATAYRNSIAAQEVEANTLKELNTKEIATAISPLDEDLDCPAGPTHKEAEAAQEQAQDASQAAEAAAVEEKAAAALAATPWWNWPDLSLDWPRLQALLRTPSLMDAISRALARHTNDSLFTKCLSKLMAVHTEFFTSSDWDKTITQNIAFRTDPVVGRVDSDATPSVERTGVSGGKVVSPRFLDTFVQKLDDVGAPPVLGKVFSALSDLARGFQFLLRSKQLRQLELKFQAKRDDLETDVAILAAQNVGLTKVHRQVQVRLKFESAQSRSARQQLTFLQQLRSRLDRVDLQNPVFDHWEAFAKEDVALKAMPALPSYAVLRAALIVSGGATDEAFRAELAEYWLECCQLLSIPTFVERDATQAEHTKPTALNESLVATNRTSLQFTSGLFVQTQAYRLCGDADGRFVHCLTRHDALLDTFLPRPNSTVTATAALTQRLKPGQLEKPRVQNDTATTGAVSFSDKKPMDFFGLQRGVDAAVFHQLIFDRRRLIRVCGDHPFQNLADLQFCGQHRQLQLAVLDGTNSAFGGVRLSPSASPRSPLGTPRSWSLAGAPHAGPAQPTEAEVVRIYFLPPNISHCRQTLFCCGMEMPRIWVTKGSSSPKKGITSASPLMMMLRTATQQGSDVIVHAAYLDSSSIKHVPGSISNQQHQQHADADTGFSRFVSFEDSSSTTIDDSMFQEVDTVTVAAFFSLLQELTSGQQTAFKFSWPTGSAAPPPDTMQGMDLSRSKTEPNVSSSTIHERFRLVLYHQPEFDPAIFGADVSCVHLATPATSRLRFAHDALARGSNSDTSGDQAGADQVGARERPGALWETMLDLRDLVTHDGEVLSTRKDISQHCYDWGGLSASELFEIDQRALDTWVDLVGAHAQAAKARDQLAMRVARKNHVAGTNVLAHELALVSWANLCFVTLKARNHFVSVAHSAGTNTPPLYLRAPTGQQLVEFLFLEGEAHVKCFEAASDSRSRMRSLTRSTADHRLSRLDNPSLVDWACFVKVLCTPQALTTPQRTNTQAPLSAIEMQHSPVFARCFQATALVLALFWVTDESKVQDHEIWLFSSGGRMHVSDEAACQQKSKKQQDLRRLCDMIHNTTAKGIENLVLRLSGGGSTIRSSNRRVAPVFLQVLLQQPSFEQLRKKFESGDCQGYIDAVKFWSKVTKQTDDGGKFDGVGKKAQNQHPARVRESCHSSPKMHSEAAALASRQNNFRVFAERMRMALGSTLQSSRSGSPHPIDGMDAFEGVSSLGSPVSHTWLMHILSTWRLGLILFASVPATDDTLVVTWILDECFLGRPGSDSFARTELQPGGNLSADELCILRFEVWKQFCAQRHFAFTRPLHRISTWQRLQANTISWGSAGGHIRRYTSAAAGSHGFLTDFAGFLGNWIQKHRAARDRLSSEMEKSDAIPLQHLVLSKLTQQASVLVEFGLAIGRACGLRLQGLANGGERAHTENVGGAQFCTQTLRPALQGILACGIQLPTEGHRVWPSLLVRLDELTQQHTKDLMSRVSTGMSTNAISAARTGSQSNRSQQLVTLDYWWERIVTLMQKTQW